jgi:HAD superfamily hydrolase (TIGR01484 family)
MKRIIAFDLDGTLAVSKQALDEDMARRLADLLTLCPICVISGGDWPQFQTQVIDRLPAGAKLDNLILMPTTGAKYYRFDGGWRQVYAESFSDDERRRVLDAFKSAVAQAGFAHETTWGEQIEDRGTQITFSGLGQKAPPDVKERWDPDQSKRRALKAILDAALPDLSVRIGGTTSIDVTRRGVDKGYGMRRLSEQTGVPLNEMMFVGDALYPGGNDVPARDAGVPTVGVGTIGDTRVLIAAIVTFAGGGPSH